MAQKQSQEQSLVQIQTQTQQLLPQQLLLSQLVELPVADLESFVKNEVDENPALETEPRDEADRMDDGGEETNENENEHYDSMEQYAADRRADYASEDETPDYLLNTPSQGNAMEFRPFTPGQGESFYDRLLTQVGEYELTDKQRDIVEYLIGSLDSDGLLRKPLYAISDELAIYQDIDATEEEIGACLKVLQSFEPLGIAAQSLQECLLIQLRESDRDESIKKIEMDLLENHFDDFTHKRIERLSQLYNRPVEAIQALFDDLKRLNPRPGSALDDTVGQNGQQIMPDFMVREEDDGSFLVSLNHGEVPELRVSRSFRDSMEEYARNKGNLTRQQRDTYTYVKQRVDAAQNFINAIRQRHDTLMRTMRAIVDWQQAFFREGDETLLRPMILKDIAAKTGLDISTISRVSNSKYVDTDHGVFPLKFFFNNRFSAGKDGEEVSKAQLTAAIRQLIDTEDKQAPLSDEAIVEKLQAQGYDVARRTVAKYRTRMGIPVARLRK